MTHTLRKIESSEADNLKAITEYLEILQKQGKLLYIRHSPSNVILSWALIWKILTGLYLHRVTIREAFHKIKSACFRKLPESQLGISDLIVFKTTGIDKNGTWCDCTDVLCIEVKSAKGKIQTAQSAWAGLAIDQGMRHIIARSLDDAILALK